MHLAIFHALYARLQKLGSDILHTAPIKDKFNQQRFWDLVRILLSKSDEKQLSQAGKTPYPGFFPCDPEGKRGASAARRANIREDAI